MGLDLIVCILAGVVVSVLTLLNAALNNAEKSRIDRHFDYLVNQWSKPKNDAATAAVNTEEVK